MIKKFNHGDSESPPPPKVISKFFQGDYKGLFMAILETLSRRIQKITQLDGLLWIRLHLDRLNLNYPTETLEYFRRQNLNKIT